MGMSTDGQISFGILFDEGYEFPWDQHDMDIEDWWLKIIHKFEHPNDLYNSDGEYKNGIRPSQSDIDAYYKVITDFRETLPKVPFELVNYCSGECSMYILALSTSVKTANRGYPVEFSVADINVAEDDIKRLVDFCKEYNIEHNSEPSWYLSSYLG